MRHKTVVKENLSEQIYRDIRLSLMDGEFRPGERLTISSVAEQYGTSITPVREALFRLASERALQVKAATSIVVPQLTPRDLREIVAIRRELEGMAAYRVCELVTPEIIAEFEAQNATFIKVVSNARDAARANRDFHFLNLHLAQMPYVETICENMWTLMGPFLRTFHEEVPLKRLSADDHLHFKYIAALKAGDPEAARDAMRQDIAWSYELITKHEQHEKGGRETA